MVFDEFSPEMRKYIKEAGMEIPTEIQRRAIPEIYKGKSLLLISETGTGKTEAALLPLLDMWLRKGAEECSHYKKISILYITPLKSLNRDMLKRVNWWANRIGIEVYVRHGDTSRYERAMHIQNPGDLMIITPETLQAIIVGKKLKSYLKNVRHVVIDEVHELVYSKRGVQLSVALERLERLTGRSFQRICLSATVNDARTVAKFFGVKEVIDASSSAAIKIETRLVGEPKERINYIINDVKKHRASLIFTNTREAAEIIASMLKVKDGRIDVHHSSISKESRIKVENEFKKGALKAIVCTSSLELGIDIGIVENVIQYMSPRQVTKLLQRVGRSGHRVGEVSKGIILAVSNTDCLESCVISKLAEKRKLEKKKVYGKSLDVLMHQVAGMLIEGMKNMKEIYDLVKRAYPFRDLKIDEMFEVCKTAERLKYLWVNVRGGEIFLKKRKGIYDYYFKNVSTIPDTKRYKMVDITSKKVIASLDSSFVNFSINEGDDFICRGTAWKAVEIGDNVLLAERSENEEAAIPSWEGELIPVHEEVAKEVEKLMHALIKNESKRSVEMFERHFNLDKRSARLVLRFLERQKKYFIPSPDKLFVERDKGLIVLYTFMGTPINEAIKSMLNAMLSERISRIKSDAYRVAIFGKFISENAVINVLREVNPSILEEIILSSLKFSPLFLKKLFNVAQRVGILEKGKVYTKGDVLKIADAYKNTFITREAVNEIMMEKMDVEGAKSFIKKIKEKKKEIVPVNGPSPLTMEFMEMNHEFLYGQKTKEVMDIVKRRLMKRELILVCMNCGKSFITRVKDFEEGKRCKECGSILFGVLKPSEEQSLKAFKKYLAEKKISKEEEKIVENLITSSNLLLNHGKNALLVLAGKGIGVRAAKRIFLKCPGNEKELIDEIIKEERKYLRSRRFWGDF